MAYSVSVSVRAQRDLARIYNYIGAADSEAARKWYLGLRESILALEKHPNRWPVTHENGQLRQILYGNKPHVYRAIYRVLERRKKVEVIYIRHGARERV